MYHFTTTPERSATMRKRPCKDHQMPCIICGKPIDTKSPTAKWVHLWNGGDAVVTEEEAEAAYATGDSSGDMGAYPVGSDCLRRNPELRPYVR